MSKCHKTNFDDGLVGGGSNAVATSYTKFVCDALMLEKISDEDIKRVVGSLKLSAKGKPLDILTKDEYDSTSKWDGL